jgi:hypothetical protein
VAQAAVLVAKVKMSHMIKSEIRSRGLNMSAVSTHTERRGLAGLLLILSTLFDRKRRKFTLIDPCGIN